MNQMIKKSLYRMMLLTVNIIAQLAICNAGAFAALDSTARATELRIDPASAVAGIDTELFDSIKYVPLETNKQSEFLNISQLEVTENHFIVLDKGLNTLFFFKRDGSFDRKIDKDNEGSPFKSISHFTMDESRNILLVNDNLSFYLYEFDLNGNFLKTTDKMIDKTTGSFHDYTLYNGFKIRHFNHYHIAPEGSRAAIIVSDAVTDKRLASYLPLDSLQGDADAGVSASFYRSDEGRLLLSRSCDYTIYELDTNGILHDRYRVIFPLSNTLPADFLTNPIFDGKRMDYISSNRSVIYWLQGVYEIGDWLVFYPRNSIQGSTFLYNLTTNDLYNLKETIDSQTSLAVTEFLRPVLSVDQGALISPISFFSLKKLYEEAPKSQREDLFPPNLTALMMKKSHNPILRLSYLNADLKNIEAQLND